MGLLEPWHIIIIALAFLFFFGGKKIPELMRGLGRGMKEFKDAQNGEGNPPANTTTEEKPKN
ncbi:MAG: twin-arginine translocase TatA/TatE family subunit [Mucilaginibacter sp.]